MNLRSPLRQVKGLGSAKTGTQHFISQRVSAIALLFLGTWFAFSLASQAGGDYDQISQWLSSPFNALAMVLFLATAFYHATLGIQVVLEDYVASHGKRLIALLIVKYALIVLGAGSILSVLKIYFSA